MLSFFQEPELAILHHILLGIQLLLVGKQNDIDIGIVLPDLLQGIQAIDLTVQIVIQDHDGRIHIQVLNAGLPLRIEIDVRCEGLQFLSDECLVDEVIFYYKDPWLCL